jgi:exopolysaccharide biosynthesis WecB/TagA/CpsF family protein
MLKVCEHAARESLPIYLYGSKPDIIATLSRNLKAWFPDLIIAGAQPSRFRNVSPVEKQDIARKIKDSGAAIVFVGLGCPRQEVWVYEYSDTLSMPIIAVGAAFDFHAGRLSRAPYWMQQVGLEWFYRLICEPKRLWKRYVLLNPLYIFLLGLQLFKLKKFDPLQADRPEQEILYG